MSVRFWMTRLCGFASLFVSVSCAVASDCDSCDSMESACDAYCTETACRDSAWMFTADALFLRRSDPSSDQLIVNTANAAQSLNASDFRFGNEAGLDLSLTRRLSGGNSWELRYFGVDQWDESVTEATTSGDLLRIDADVPVFVTAGDAIAARYTSELQNAEFNYMVGGLDSFDFLIGFRYLELNENAGATLTGAAIPASYDIETENRLYGGQIGARARLLDGSLMNLTLTGKAGVYSNDASQESLVTSGANNLSATGSGSPTSFVGEIGVLSGVRLTDSLTFRSGYRMLWLDRVAVASDQLSSSDFFGGTGFDDSGDLFYHGAFVGIEFAR